MSEPRKIHLVKEPWAGESVRAWCDKITDLHEIDLDVVDCEKCVETALNHHESYVNYYAERLNALRD